MHWRPILALLLVAVAGCASAPSNYTGNATDPSLPGVLLAGNATLRGDVWQVRAKAFNQGTQTYQIETGCGSPINLWAHADAGDPYREAQCLAYTPPVPFGPGQTAARTWNVHAGDLHWSGSAHFTLTFTEADNVRHIVLALS